jgi:cytochrome c553
MKKITTILAASILSVTVASANDTLKKSMDMMQKGIEQVQYGFVNNNKQMILDGLADIKKGNSLFSSRSIIKKSLPSHKKHMVNVAVNTSKRITADATIIELNLDDKAYIKAADGYADMINACSRCHGIVRNW